MRSGAAERSFGTPRGTWEGRRQGHGGVVGNDIGSGRHKSIFGNHVIGRQGCYCDLGASLCDNSLCDTVHADGG
jgi:hypothetical protein